VRDYEFLHAEVMCSNSLKKITSYIRKSDFVYIKMATSVMRLEKRPSYHVPLVKIIDGVSIFRRLEMIKRESEKVVGCPRQNAIADRGGKPWKNVETYSISVRLLRSCKT